MRLAIPMAPVLPRDIQPLGPASVALWLLPVGVNLPPQLAEDLAVLSDEERARAARFRRPEDRTLFITGRLGVRLLAARYVDADPRDLRIAQAPGHKPEIAGPPHASSLHFNLSHTSGLVVWAFALDRPVGVDAERVSRMAVFGSDPSAFFANSERTVLASVPDAERPRWLADHWTIKEAYVKAEGSGLTRDVSVEPFVDGPGLQCRCLPGGDVDTEQWDFRLFRPTEEHSVALCAHMNPGERPAVMARQILWSAADRSLVLG
jgi:4'-phosphopantetheinyl transferase